VLVIDGRFDEAAATFDKALALNPRDFQSRIAQFVLAMTQDRMADANAVLVAFAESTSPYEQWLSQMAGALVDARLGRVDAMLKRFDQAARLPRISLVNRVIANQVQADTLASLGRANLALPIAERIQADAHGRRSARSPSRAQAAAGHAEALTVARADERGDHDDRGTSAADHAVACRARPASMPSRSTR
jgi:tetratricopeptide (TPR) repeat protein